MKTNSSTYEYAQLSSFTYEYARPSVTVTIFAFFDGQILTGIRNFDADAFSDTRCIPGGFLNAKHAFYLGETAKQAAIREFKEETNIEIFPEQLILFHEHSHPTTDPRAHVVNLCYIVNLVGWQAGQAKAGDDLRYIEWIYPFDVYASEQEWAFNHKELTIKAISVHNQYEYFRR